MRSELAVAVFLAVFLLNPTAKAQEKNFDIQSLKNELSERLQKLEETYAQTKAEAKAATIGKMKELAVSQMKEGKIRDATETWEVIIGVAPHDEEAKKFFDAIGRQPQPRPERDLGQMLLGRWKWSNGTTLDFLAEGACFVYARDGSSTSCSWRIDDSGQVVTFHGDRETGSLRFSHEGRMLEGDGSKGQAVWGVKLFDLDEIETPLSEEPIADRLPGNWEWFTGVKATFFPNNRVVLHRNGGEAWSWKITPRDRTSIVIMNEQGKITDHSIKMTRDGTRLEGITSDGRKMWMKRID